MKHISLHLNSQYLTLLLLISLLTACGANKSASGNPDSRTELSEISDVTEKNVPLADGDLTRAARDGDLPRVKELLASGALINEQIVSASGTITPLLAAVIMGHAEVAQYLVMRGADTQSTFQGYRAQEFYVHKGLHRQGRSLPWIESEKVGGAR
jgi:hypothetical protein